MQEVIARLAVRDGCDGVECASIRRSGAACVRAQPPVRARLRCGGTRGLVVSASQTRGATWFARLLVSPLIAALVSACGSGGPSAVPGLAPTRQIFPTAGPGTPTLPRPRFPPTPTPTATGTPPVMTFSFKSACPLGQTIRLRLFDETDGLIFLDDMHDFIITSSATSIAIACRIGNNICYGGLTTTATTPAPSTTPQPTPTPANTFGVGLNNDQQCSDCCFVCAGGATVPEIDLRCMSP
jgi:hypothetical protein